MANFDDILNSVPEPDRVSGRLFSEVIKHPAAAKLIKEVISAISEQVMERGGSLNIVNDGPDQGITVEVDGKVMRITPCSPNDPEEAAINLSEHRLIQKGEMQDPIAVHISTLRNLLITDSRLKDR